MIAGILVGVGAVIAIIALTRGGENPASPRTSPSIAAAVLPPSSLAQIDPATGRASLVAPDIPGLDPDQPVDPNLAVGEGGVWLYSYRSAGGAFLLDLDEGTGEVRQQVQVPFVPGAGAGLAVGSRTVWFSGSGSVTSVSRMNPSTHEPLRPVSVSGASRQSKRVLLVTGADVAIRTSDQKDPHPFKITQM